MAIENDIFDLAQSMNCEELHFVNDEKTGLKGIVAIHNTNLGPSLGGCRWMEYDSTYDAVKDAIRLAEGMTYKSAAANIPLGGGKAVIIKPKSMDNIDKHAYFAAYGEFIEKLNGRYITAIDSGVTTAEMNMIAKTTKYVANTSNCKFSKSDPSPCTAFGVIRGIESAVFYKLDKKELEGIHVAIQGLGAVGYKLAKNLYEQGAKLSVYDIDQEAINRCVNEFKATPLSSNEEILQVECDVFAPCAKGAILNEETIPKIKAKIIAGGANNQLANPVTDAKAILDRGILYAPDFVINAGGLIYVGCEMINEQEEKAIDRVSNLYNILTEIYIKAEKEKKSTYEVAYQIAHERVKNARVEVV